MSIEGLSDVFRRQRLTLIVLAVLAVVVLVIVRGAALKEYLFGYGPLNDWFLNHTRWSEEAVSAIVTSIWAVYVCAFSLLTYWTIARVFVAWKITFKIIATAFLALILQVPLYALQAWLHQAPEQITNVNELVDCPYDTRSTTRVVIHYYIAPDGKILLFRNGYGGSWRGQALKPATPEICNAAQLQWKKSEDEAVSRREAQRLAELNRQQELKRRKEEEERARALAESQKQEKAMAAISQRLQELITAKSYKEQFSAAVQTFYRNRKYAPIWISGGETNNRATKAIAYLKTIESEGLDPNDYPIPEFKDGGSDALADAEIKLTTSVLAYVHDAKMGRVRFSSVSANIAYDVIGIDEVDVLRKLSETSDIGTLLASYNPQQPGYRSLKDKLADLRTVIGQVVKSKPYEAPTSNVFVPEGAILRPGMNDHRVVILRKRLNVSGDKNNTLYDETVTEAVRAFQRAQDLDPNGNLGPNTVRALNGTNSEKRLIFPSPIETIIANMERWRWMPHDLGEVYVIVNIPDYTLKIIQKNRLLWQTKVVVGRPSRPTPLLSVTMKHIWINPTWVVPELVAQEYRSALKEDPDALRRIGIAQLKRKDGSTLLVQLPGAGNTLGRIVFDFPNRFGVFQHDTPDKYLFKRDKRAFASCDILVEDPLEYATKVLSITNPTEHYTPARFESMFGKSGVEIALPPKIAVHLTYQTAFVDEDSHLQLREDLYGYDSRILQLIQVPEKSINNEAELRYSSNSCGIASIQLDQNLDTSNFNKGQGKF